MMTRVLMLVSVVAAATPAVAQVASEKAPVSPAAAARGSSRPVFQWEVPELIASVDSPWVQVSDGVPMKLQAARSRRPVQELLQHFVDEFQEAGLFIPPGHEQIQAFREPQLTALDPDRMVAYTVIFQPNADRTVTLIFGTSDLSGYEPSRAKAALGWAPLPPGAQVMMRTEMEGNHSAVIAVSSSEEEVMTFYREAMKRAGFQEEDPGQFMRGSEMIRVMPQRKGGELSVGLLRRVVGPEELASR